MKLWYKNPARDWIEGLPIGNGRLAAMVHGTYKRERIALNHEWLWTPFHRNRDTEVRSQFLPEVRRLLLSGQYAEGTQAGNDAFGGGGGTSGIPMRVDCYQPAADLYLEFNHNCINDYVRELDLDRACATVSYGVNVGSVRHVRQYVAHLMENLILVRVTQEGSPFDCVAWLDRTFDPDCELEFETSNDLLLMKGRLTGALDFQVKSQVWCQGGEARVIDGRKVLLQGVTEAVFAINIGVSAGGKVAAEECAERSLQVPVAWDQLLEQHVREHKKHFGSMELELASEEPELPTDERLRILREGVADPNLALLYFHYGRYLLSASSANASLPANLQGKWNEDIRPPWDCDYHNDINIQMNYWIAEPTGMQRYTDALFRYMERMVPHARKVAMDLYGCRGIYFPIQTDAWGRATPESHGWCVWVGAAPWLAQHMWWHYEFGQDVGFLRERAYPFFKEVAAFFEDYLVEDENGILQVVPSQSPENRFVGGGEFAVDLCVSATMDVILIKEALGYAIRSAEILGMDEEKCGQWKDMVKGLPALQIGRHGQLQEWNQDFEEFEPGHRHFSHLIGLYPGDSLDRESTPDLWRAAEISLERRLAAGGGHCGWSRAWVSCFFARLGRPREAWEHYTHLITDFTTDSLLDIYPPRMFQIEGNFAGAAAVMEMLLQCYHGVIHFLPALPEDWPAGRASGIRTRGGFTVGMEWAEGQLIRASIRKISSGVCTVVCAPDAWQISDSTGSAVSTRHEGNRLIFEAVANEIYQLTRDLK